MAMELSANELQTVQANAAVIWEERPVPCSRGLVYHRDGSGLVRLASPSAIGANCRRRCCCQDFPNADYLVEYGANIQIPDGGTVGPISLGLYIDGELDPSTVRTITPAAVQQLGNVSAAAIVSVPCICRCASISVRNVSDQAIEVVNANVVISYNGIRR